MLIFFSRGAIKRQEGMEKTRKATPGYLRGVGSNLPYYDKMSKIGR